jgi:hypothetical protein
MKTLTLAFIPLAFILGCGLSTETVESNTISIIEKKEEFPVDTIFLMKLNDYQYEGKFRLSDSTVYNVNVKTDGEIIEAQWKRDYSFKFD